MLVRNASAQIYFIKVKKKSISCHIIRVCTYSNTVYMYALLTYICFRCSAFIAGGLQSDSVAYRIQCQLYK